MMMIGIEDLALRLMEDCLTGGGTYAKAEMVRTGLYE